MLAFLSDHSQALTVISNMIMTIIWLVYLNLFFVSHRRQKAPMILISRGAGIGPEARLFISNMGAEPIYVSALIADCYTGDEVATAFITQNDHISGEELSSPGAATNEGPLGSGDYMDAGSFDSLMNRIERHSDHPLKARDVDRVTVTVVASTGYSALISAASTTYTILRSDGNTVFHPEHISTVQHRGLRARRRVRRRLEQQSEREVSLVSGDEGRAASEAAA